MFVHSLTLLPLHLTYLHVASPYLAFRSNQTNKPAHSLQKTLGKQSHHNQGEEIDG